MSMLTALSRSFASGMACDISCLLHRLTRGAQHEYDVDSQKLQRSFELGAWLKMGRQKFLVEKMYATTASTYKQWLQDNCSLGYPHCCKLIKLSEQLAGYPKLTLCSVSLSFMLRRLKKIVQACECDQEFGDLWKDVPPPRE